MLLVGGGGHTASLLPEGRILVAGGVGIDMTAKPTTQLFDPATEMWSASTPLDEARQGATAVLLGDGRVLVLGGIGTVGNALSSAEAYSTAP
jgi:hypothetical protein